VAEGQTKIRFGILSWPQAPWPALRELVDEVTRLGFDSFWMPDHPRRGNGCWPMLAALALTTRGIRLGTLVACIYYTNPFVLARMAADIDVLSGGRFVLGLGIGDIPAEFEQMGVPWRPTLVRQQQLEDYLNIVPGVLDGATVTFHGTQVQVVNAALEAGAVQRPWVPILVAGGGERVTLRQVAQYADMANFGPHAYTSAVRTEDQVRLKLEALHRHCQALGRPYEAILRSHITLPLILADTQKALERKVEVLAYTGVNREAMVAATPEAAVCYYRGLVRAGMQYFITSVHGSDLETARLLAEQVVPAVRPL
jgi:alkanesulfonate monooxygenase SsuD/methylene tetrahydromethanopterin reductase-like flavin-dependent oxidoreductase (luciferase family)